MRSLPLILLAATLLLPVPAFAGSDDGHGDDYCKQREHTCTDVEAGSMQCMPAQGATTQPLTAVVGGADSGTFHLIATGTNLPSSGAACTFEIRIRPEEIRFNEGWTVGLLAPYGGATGVGSAACSTLPGESCETTATFTWWRAQHGVTFDVPFDLLVNGEVVAQGECHYYDPPFWTQVVGGDVVLP